MADRRDALKIIGAIGATCAFPFAGDELYGQHVHPQPGKAAELPKPSYFKESDLAVVSKIADLIIPTTDTPGAVAVGVPAYIDMLVKDNAQHQKMFQLGLAEVAAESTKKFHKGFLELTEEQQIQMLTPWSEASDAGKLDSTGPQFFRAIKSMTADGYYTSKVGLLDELGYKGNTVLAAFPVCEVPEH